MLRPLPTEAQLREFLAAHLPPNALLNAVEAIESPTRLMKREEFPNGNTPGGLNNYGWAECAVNRFRILGQHADWYRAVGWLDIYERDHRDPAKYEPTHRDAGHRYLDGFVDLYFLAKERGYEGIADRCAKLIIRDGHGHSRYDLDRYMASDFGGIRYIARSLANVAIAGWFLREIRGDDVGAGQCRETLEKALPWFLGRDFKRPATDTGADARQYSRGGWFTDADGYTTCGDHIDEAGTSWAETGSPIYIPWQTYEILPLALESAFDFVVTEIEYSFGIGEKIVNLEQSFWHHAYIDHDDPILRGVGDRKGGEFPMCFDARGAKGTRGRKLPVRLATPADYEIPTGGMLYPYWHMLDGLPSADKWHHLGRMLEATVEQCSAHWSEYLGQVLFTNGLMAKCLEWHEQREEPEPEPKPTPIRSKVRDQLTNMVKTAKREGWNAGAKAVEAYGEMLRVDDGKDAARMLRDARRAVRRG